MHDMEEQLKQTIGKAVKAARERCGVTQEQAAEKVGITVEHFARIERGKALPGLITFARIAIVLNIGADVLLDRGESADQAAREPPPWFAFPEPKESKQVQRVFRRLRTQPPEIVTAIDGVLKQLSHFVDRKQAEADDKPPKPKRKKPAKKSRKKSPSRPRKGSKP